MSEGVSNAGAIIQSVWGDASTSGKGLAFALLYPGPPSTQLTRQEDVDAMLQARRFPFLRLLTLTVMFLQLCMHWAQNVFDSTASTAVWVNQNNQWAVQAQLVRKDGAELLALVQRTGAVAPWQYLPPAVGLSMDISPSVADCALRVLKLAAVKAVRPAPTCMIVLLIASALSDAGVCNSCKERGRQVFG
jgi:hypothetical protein